MREKGNRVQMERTKWKEYKIRIETKRIETTYKVPIPKNLGFKSSFLTLPLKLVNRYLSFPACLQMIQILVSPSLNENIYFL